MSRVNTSRATATQDAFVSPLAGKKRSSDTVGASTRRSPFRKACRFRADTRKPFHPAGDLYNNALSI